MKKITIILLLIAGNLSMNAQNLFKFGVAGGLNVSKITSDKDSKTLNGFHAGLITEVKLPVTFGFETDVLYSTKGGVYDGFNNNLEPTDWDYNLSYVDVPILAKLYILKVINIQAGPQFSYLLSGKFNETNVKDDLKSMDISAVAGIGVDVTKIHVAVRYNYGLTNIGDGDGKNNVIQASVGYWIK